MANRIETVDYKLGKNKKSVSVAQDFKSAVLLLKRDAEDEMLAVEDRNHKVSDCNRRGYVINRYIIWLCNSVIKKLNKGISPEAIIEALKVTDWDKHSFGGHVFSGDYLRELMGKKKEDVIVLLARQAYYLELASDSIIHLMDE